VGPSGVAGSAPTLSQFVVKLHSRCNLSCDHCYVYESVDQGWLGQPLMMADQTISAAAGRIAEHAARNNLAEIQVVLHGGEPLLVGREPLRRALDRFRVALAPVTRLHLGMQTNGLLLTDEIAEVLREFDVRVGVSLDGDVAANDRHRRFANGASSHAGVLRALEILRRPRYRHLYGGILCTVDLGNDPIVTYEALLAQRPPRIDFLLPHATWDQPPPRPTGDPSAYGAWLGQVHTRWHADGRPMSIRLFDSLDATAAGRPSQTEWVGLDAVDFAVIETDGSWEQVDSLKTAYVGAAGTGLNVFEHPVAQVAAHPGMARRQHGLADLCVTCRRCPVVEQCGGGLFTHRFRGGTDFDNPSVYCSDLKEIIATVNASPAPRPAVAPDEPRRDEPRRDEPVPDDLFDQLASGVGDASAIAFLDDHQQSISRKLLAAIVFDGAEDGPNRLAWRILLALDATAPAAVRTVVSHPYVRVWAVGRLRSSGGSADDAYLSRLAASATIRARAEMDLPVVLDGQRLHLPGLGTLMLPAAPAATARLTVTADEVTLGCGGTTITVATETIRGDDVSDVAGWQPVSRVLTNELTLVLEDQDPYRDCHQWSTGGPLSTAAVDEWRSSMADAWRIVRRDAPEQVPGMRVGLRLIAPLTQDPEGKLRSSTARHAFGAVAMAPANAESAAVMLVHEFQHGKMGALLDLVDLYDPRYQPLIKIGWREDPRPLEGVLQGTYAHLSVALMWLARAQRPGPDQMAAKAQFKIYHEWTLGAVDALTRTGALTPMGRRFVDGMAKALAA
jgi:uncharacterized protein